jgi:hypothetical protein
VLIDLGTAGVPGPGSTLVKSETFDQVIRVSPCTASLDNAVMPTKSVSVACASAVSR